MSDTTLCPAVNGQRPATENTGYAANVSRDEVQFAQHRLYLNQIDTFHGRQIANILSEKLFRASSEDADEEMAEEEETERATIPLMPVSQLKYEIIGSLKNPFYKYDDNVKYVLNNMDEKSMLYEIMHCGLIVYDITSDNDQIEKAWATFKALEAYLEDIDAKKLKELKEDRVFVLISTVMTWAKTKPIDPEDPDVPFVENDYRKRKPHPNYQPHIDLEKEVIVKGKKQLKGKLRTYVVCCGITYGGEEDDLHFLFKAAWNNLAELPLIMPGNNTIPLLNVKDLVMILFRIFETLPKKPTYILAVEQTMSTQKSIVKALTKTLGSSRVRLVTPEQSYLYPEMNQATNERLQVHLKMEPASIVSEMDLQWQNDMNMCENIQKIVKEYKESRKLQPIKIILLGPPAAGKTEIAKQLATFYDLHYISVSSLIQDALTTLRTNIKYTNELIKIKEAKAGQEEEEEAEEEEDDEDEDIEGAAAELQMKLKNLERGLEEGPDGRLPDDVIIELLKERLSSNACQNQGYLLDGFPKTAEQTKIIFEIADEGGEEEEGGDDEGVEEEGNETEEITAKKLMLPDHVISLEASDEYLCTRVMSFPESKIQGSHYMEELMIRRLDEYRTNNNEDNSLLNVFDEIEIHPFIIDAETDDQNAILSLIKEKIGKPKGYPLSDFELEQIRLLEEENQNRVLEEQARLREEMDRKAKEDKEANMERWIDMLQTLQHEEEHMLTAQSKPLREYIIKFIFPTLTRGLLETARIKPEDPVDFLAEYLFKMNPEGRMFDPSFVNTADELFQTIDEFQNRLGL